MTAVGSSYILSSEWLTIASAVASSSAVAMTGLRLVGRVSTFKPTGYLIVSALALGLLGEMLKGLEWDLSPMIASYTPTLSYNGQNYLIARTAGDGACGAHALLGTNMDGVWRYDGHVRSYYVNELKKKFSEEPAIKVAWEEMMVLLLKDRLSPKPGYAKYIFSDLNMECLKSGLHILHSQIEEVKKRRDGLLLETRQIKEVADLLKEVPEADWVTQLLNERDTIISLTAQHNSSLCQQLINSMSEMNQLESKKADRYQEFIEVPETQNAYIQGVLNDEYFFSTQELGLMARVFNKHVTVLIRNGDGTCKSSIDKGDPSDEHVFIFHQGDHFSRCERILK